MSEEMSSYIDHTLLKPDATREDIIKLCFEAVKYRFHSVCINPSYVAAAAQELKNTGIIVCAVVGFPLGATTTAVKAFEAAEAIEHGATEIDMVLHVGALKSGNQEYVRSDIAAVVRAAKNRPVKVIIETGLLTEEEKKLACRLAEQAGATYIKTSTGFGPGGASIADIQLMRETVGPKMKIKASGGVRTTETARRMIEAGATRIGTSSGPALINFDKDNGLV